MVKGIEEGQSYTDLPIKGMTFSKVYSRKQEELYFETSEGRIFILYHEQDCCESVSIDDIVGELDSLVGYPLVVAEEASFSGTSHDSDSFTWTFYRFRTVKGSVLVKWYGSSNGYYSEGVSGKWINE